EPAHGAEGQATPGRRHRDPGRRLPAARRPRSRRLLEPARRGPGRRHQHPRRSLHPRRLRPSTPRRTGQVLQLRSRRAGRRDRLRRRRLRHLPARGGGDGPAAAPPPRTRGRGAGGCGPARLAPGRQRHRHLHRRLADRLRRSPPARPGGRRPLLHDRQRAVDPRQPPGQCLRPARPGANHRHRLLLRPGRPALGLRGAARRPHPRGAGRRGEHAALALPLPRLRPGGDALADRSLPCLRRQGRRLCPRRGRRHSAAEAPRGCAGRRRCDPRRHPRLRRECRRPHPWPVAPEQPSPGPVDRAGPVRIRGGPRPHRLFRGAWHRHRRGRPAGGRRDRRRHRPPPGGEAADRLGQDQYRPYRARGRHRRPAEGHADARARPHPALAPPRDAEPAYRLRRPRPARARHGGAAAPPAACGDRGEQLRLRRHQRLRPARRRAHGAGPAGAGGAGSAPAAAAALGPQRGRAEGARWPLAGPARHHPRPCPSRPAPRRR
ncbi:MAG: Malonyl CoA-acyl carrier protein transacylase, partial [uncultured Craurococcus sp.]